MDYLKMLACLILTVLMGKWLHWYILKCNKGSFHSFCRICLKLNFLYSSITMQNDTLNFLPPSTHPPPLLPKTTNFQYLHCSHQYNTNIFFITCMSTAISLCQHCLITSTWKKKLWYILHNRKNMSLNFKPKGLQNVWWKGKWVIYVLTHIHAPPSEDIFR